MRDRFIIALIYSLIWTLIVWFIDFTNELKTRKYTVHTRKLKKPLTVLHISDLHETRFGDCQETLLKAAAKTEPDIIFITGDIVEDDGDDPAEVKVLDSTNTATYLFEGLVRLAPTYMVFGNHESNIPNTDLLCAEIEKLGVRVLHRRNPDETDMSERVVINGQSIRVCGADDPYFDRREPQKKHRSMPERLREDKTVLTYDKSVWRERLKREYADVRNDSELTLLLSHRPEEFELYGELGFDAAFSGHAHGGQWRLPPFINGIYAPHQGFFPKHAGGLYNCGGMAHIVSRGLSKKRMVRIFNPPEICAVRFVPEDRE